MERQEILNQLKNNPEVSVLIIGAGVNGIGTFRDLSLQGVDVLLIDRDDFCSGASAASSHMVHGGIRYLENGEFRLVREAVHERNRLIKNAPQYVKPLSTVIPIFKWFSGLFNAPMKFLGLLDRPSERGAVVIKIGLMFYDAFTRKQGTVPPHEFTPRKLTLKQYPNINSEVLFTARYYDGAMQSPERICVEMVLDAENHNPNSHALNYVSLKETSGSSIIMRDLICGENFNVQPKIVINAAGPWIDIVNSKLGGSTKFIGGTKGSHLIVNNPKLREAIGENEFFFENKDGRIVLIFPILDRVLIGTSDLPIDDPDEAYCTETEIDYFIEMVNIVFPGIPLTREQIIFKFSGVRPLPVGDSDNPGQISRDHSIKLSNPGDGKNYPVYNLIGGKWTSFRAFSEEITDKALERLRIPRVMSTSNLAIGGGSDYPINSQEEKSWVNSIAKDSGLEKERVRDLFLRYGTRAKAVVSYISDAEDHYLNHLSSYSVREIEFIAKYEKVIHLDDFILRRSMLAKLGQLSNASIEEITSILKSALLWTEENASEEAVRVTKMLKDRYGVPLS